MSPGHGQHEVGARELGVTDPVGGVAGDSGGDGARGGIGPAAVAALGQQATGAGIDGIAVLLIGNPGRGHDDAAPPRGRSAGRCETVDENDLGHGRAADVPGADHGDRVRAVGVAGSRQDGRRDGVWHAGQALALGRPVASRSGASQRTGRAGVSRGEPMGAAAIEADAATHVPT